MKIGQYKENKYVKLQECSNHFVESDITKIFDKSSKRTLIKDITKKVKEWLLDDTDDFRSFSFYLTDGKKNSRKTHLLFCRSEIYIKSCANCWEIWRIADSYEWPELISVKIGAIDIDIEKTVVKTKGKADFVIDKKIDKKLSGKYKFKIKQDKIVLPNEIRSTNYD